MARKEFYGDRLKCARKLRAMTLTALAAETGISKQSISLYENGDNTPEYERGCRLATALHVPYDFFFQEDSRTAITPATYFRSLTTATKLDRTAQSLKLEFVAKAYEALSTYLDFPTLNLPAVSFTGNDDEFDTDATNAMVCDIEHIASELRSYWGLGNGPIQNLQYALESNGIIVTGFGTGDGRIDAFSQRTTLDGSELCFIALDQGSKPEGRIRFDMAHELGHLLLHPWSEELDNISKDEFRLRETQANIFASAFLLPRDSFGKDAELYPTDLKYYIWLKKKWKSSIQSMIYRSHQLGIITSNQYQYMMRQVSKNGWRQHEPDDVPYFINENMFQGAVDLLKDNHVLSVSGILSLFSEYGVSLFPEEIEDLLHLSHGSLIEKKQPANIIKLKPISNDNTSTTREYEVKQAARTFGTASMDDTSDLLREFRRRKEHDSNT